MNAQTALDIAVRCGVVPAVAAMATFFAIQWLWPPVIATRYRTGLAFTIGVFVGYVLEPSTTSLAPSQFYEWIPPLGLLAAFVSGITRADGVTRGERWTAIYLFALIAALLIVPRWPELVPSWPVQWGVMAAAMLLMTAQLVPLPQRLPGRWFPWWLMLAAAAGSVLVMSEVSETFGRLAALPAGALAGCGLAGLLAKEPPDWRSLVLPYAIVVGGYAYTGAVYPSPPIWLLLLPPLAPLALWICTLGPLARLGSAWIIVVQAICVLAPLILIAVLLLAGNSDPSHAW